MTPLTVGRKIADMRQRREELGLPPLTYGIAGYSIVRDSEAEAKKEVERITNVQQSARGYANYQQWITGSQLEQKVSLEDYSVSNRGLRSGLVGTPEQVSARLAEFCGGWRGSGSVAIESAVARDGTVLRAGDRAGAGADELGPTIYDAAFADRGRYLAAQCPAVEGRIL